MLGCKRNYYMGGWGQAIVAQSRTIWPFASLNSDRPCRIPIGTFLVSTDHGQESINKQSAVVMVTNIAVESEANVLDRASNTYRKQFDVDGALSLS